MFEQKELKDGSEPQLGDLKLVAAGMCRAIGVVKGRLVMVASGGPGMRVSRLTMPFPPAGGRVLALHADGPCAVTADGSLWVWHPQSERWQACGNLLREGA
jgi:hypothetical protein